MIRNYFKTAWRTLKKTKMHSFLNIAGLSIGLTVAILIGLWLHDELTFNTGFRNYSRIAQVIQNVTNNGEVQTWKAVPYPLADELRKNYGSDFKHIAMGVDGGEHMLSFNEKKLKQSGIYFEKEMPEMFSLKMIRGNWNSLDDPSSLILSASSAKAFFGNDDPLNMMIKIDGQPPVKVTGVYEDFPRNSDFSDLKFISTWDFFYRNNDLQSMKDPWRPNFTLLYVQLNDNSNASAASARIRDAKLKKVSTQLAKKKPELFLFPMSKWHLYSEFRGGVNTGGAIQYVRMFAVIGLFVLLLACINFMNLSTARSEKRAREVGIRKTVGSLRKQIIFQFFTESLLTVLFAFVVSILLVQLLLPAFNQVANKQVSLLWASPVFWLINAGFVLITALVAGSYPAVYLSSFKPVLVLKGTFKAGRATAIPRKVLVVLQFTVSVTLFIGTIIVYRQIRFAKNRPVGYNQQGLITVPSTDSSIHHHFDAVREELQQNGSIASMAEASSGTTSIGSSSSGFSWPGKDPNLSIDFGFENVSYDYGRTIGWTLKEGRDFSPEFATDSSALILNQAAVRFMGLKHPVGETIMWFDKPFNVIGVIDDIIMGSPYEQVTPLVYNLSTGPGNVFIIRINPASGFSQALGKIEAVFRKFSPEQLFEYQFVNDDYAKKFLDEERVGRLAGFFAMIAIAISCLGLFGLTSFVAEQRTREIGVRKALGASVLSVWNLLSRDFMVLVIISFFIAVPLSWYAMHHWLQNYSYRTRMQWWIFGAAGAGSLFITLTVVSVQTIKAALANPVKSLRTE